MNIWARLTIRGEHNHRSKIALAAQYYNIQTLINLIIQIKIGLFNIVIMNNNNNYLPILQRLIVSFMKAISIFDRNPQPIGLNNSHTTFIGSVCGILSVIVLAGLAISKIYSVFNYETLYLNYWVTEEAWLVQLNDMQLSMEVDAGIKPPTFIGSAQQYAKQHRSKFRRITPKTIGQGLGGNCRRDQGLQALLVKSKSNRKNDQFFNLVACEDDQLMFCIPKNVTVPLTGLPYFPEIGYEYAYIMISNIVSDQTLKTDPSGKYKLPQSKSNKNILNQQKNCEEEDMIIVITLYFSDKSVNPRNFEPRIRYPTMKNQFFLTQTSQQSSFFFNEMYFSSINVTTDWNLLPSFIADNKESKVYWKHQKQLDYTSPIQHKSNKFYFICGFNRAPVSNMYQRSYKKIDSVIAEILGISSIIGIIIYLLLIHHSSWSSRVHLLKSSKKYSENEQQQMKEIPSNLYIEYLNQKTSCKKEKKRKLKKQEKQIEQIMSCGNLLQLYQRKKELKDVEIKMNALQQLLRKDEGFRKKYDQIIYEKRQQMLKQDQSSESEPEEAVESQAQTLLS